MYITWPRPYCCHDGHFPKARFASRIRIDEQDFGGGLGPRHAGGPVNGRKLFPESNVLLFAVEKAEHGTRAPAEVSSRRIGFSAGCSTAFDGGSFEFHRQKILKHGAAIGIGVKRLPATTTRAAKT